MTIDDAIVMKLRTTPWRPPHVPTIDSTASHRPGSPSGRPPGPSTAGLAERLSWAIDAGEVEVHYQPLIDLRDGMTVRVEALARWPKGAPHGPDAFVIAAEQADTVVELDLHVIRTVVDQMGAWKAAGVAAVVSVNMSQRTLARSGAVAETIATVIRAGMSPSMLRVEVTETAETDIETLSAAIDELRSAGLRVALDDFGTRYSFLPHLLATAADELKIDRLFVRFLPDERARLIMSSVVDLAHDLGLEVVAEGVETVAQLDCVRELGCDVVQGFLFSPALDSAAVTAEFGRVHDLVR